MKIMFPEYENSLLFCLIVLMSLLVLKEPQYVIGFRRPYLKKEA